MDEVGLILLCSVADTKRLYVYCSTCYQRFGREWGSRYKIWPVLKDHLSGFRQHCFSCQKQIGDPEKTLILFPQKRDSVDSGFILGPGDLTVEQILDPRFKL